MDINNYSYTPYMLDENDDIRDNTPVYDPRAITLSIMYDGCITGIQAARLDTKNYIYDRMIEKVKTIIPKKEV